ncbi:unnamed protein product [Amoebophrya sp. A120]|nr:unnamed protein product [Amoebophrya sp. A120]|eukprot:GSA120T00000228001.1
MSSLRSKNCILFAAHAINSNAASQVATFQRTQTLLHLIVAFDKRTMRIFKTLACSSLLGTSILPAAGTSMTSGLNVGQFCGMMGVMMTNPAAPACENACKGIYTVCQDNALTTDMSAVPEFEFMSVVCKAGCYPEAKMFITCYRNANPNDANQPSDAEMDAAYTQQCGAAPPTHSSLLSSSAAATGPSKTTLLLSVVAAAAGLFLATYQTDLKLIFIWFAVVMQINRPARRSSS